MIRDSLETFVNDVMGQAEISTGDVRRLQSNILADGIETRDEADVLIALDRAIHEKTPAWSAYVIQAVVDFVVWTSRPTGYIDRDTAQWLTTSLSCGTGPTPVALAIAFEVVRECERADEVLVTFVMRWARGRAHELQARTEADGIA
ncbi:MAG TPA: hypothetical protein VGO82_04475 [Enterovirga sp.]|jgi:hypothetical protein|nr:hypothetical protein [Enterovirga sp.]